MLSESLANAVTWWGAAARSDIETIYHVIFFAFILALASWNPVYPLGLIRLWDFVGEPRTLNHISGNVGVGRAILGYTDVTAKEVTSEPDGSYVIEVPFGWSGIVTPKKSRYDSSPSSKSYTNPVTDLGTETYTALPSPAAATRIVLTSGNGQTATHSAALANPFVVTVKDESGNRVPEVNAAFSIASVPDGATGQALSVGTTRTNGDGQASTVLMLGNKTGTYTVNALSSGLSGSPVTFTATGTNAVFTSIESLPGRVPNELILTDAYPNPFNPSTTIRFSLPKAATVSPRIFNSPGQEVAVSANEWKESGSYQAMWNAAMFPSGIYIFRLQAGSFIDSKKLILQK